MKLHALGLVVALASLPALAQEQNFDRRPSMDLGRAAPTGDQVQALSAFEAQLGGDLLASFDEVTGVTRTLMNPAGRLIQPASGLAPIDVARRFVEENLTLLGLEEGDVQELETCDAVYSSVTGATHVHLCQSFRGIPVFNARIQVNVSRDGAVTGVSNAFVPRLGAHTAGLDELGGIAAGIEAADALDAVRRHLGLPVRDRASVAAAPRGARRASRLQAADTSGESIPVELLWLPIGRHLRLAWKLQIHTLDGAHVYETIVDATRGLDASDPSRVLTRFDLVADAQYLVYPAPVESPNHTSPLPPADARVVAVDPADSTASPLGWHSTGSQSYSILRGNNVHAYDDRNADDQPPSSEPTCTAGDCSFSLNLSADPTFSPAASIANAFYWTNYVHDVQYRYGFDEAAGNFQVNNFGRGGAGNDPLLAETQDGSGFNNANMFTPSDGSRPRMQLFLWDRTSPRRDSALDDGIIVHEYGHGISNRLVGGPSNVLCLMNAQQPGEGLSDWWALAYTAKPGDTGPMPRGIATYVMGHPVNGAGIRIQRYSTDPTVNNHTYASIAGKAVPHGVGEVWAQGAWEVYWALVDAHGFDPDLTNATGGAGNQRMMLYVNEGLKATACSPTFTDVRDGILQAAMSLHGGEDVCRLWRAFADFGLGVDAVSGGPSSTNATNGFALPAACDPGPRIVSPAPGSTLTSANATFTWDPNGETVDDYELHVGSSAGASDLFQSGSLGTALSIDVSGLPVDGRTLYVRLRFLIAGNWGFRDYTFKAFAAPPSMVSPPPGSTLPGSQVTFQWTTGGTSVLDFWLYVGTSVGGAQIKNSGSLGASTLSYTLNGVPTDGRTIHVRLWWLLPALGWKYADSTYTAANTADPRILSPVPGSTLPGSEALFSWTADGASVTSWQLWAGRTPGGQEHFASGVISGLSVTATNLPKDGSTVYVRLHFLIGGAWSFHDYTYVAKLGTPQLTAPPPGSTLPGAQVTFQWTSDGAPVTEWRLTLGSTLGASDLFDSGSLGLATSVSVSNLPTDGRTIHARLYYRLNGGSWTSRDSTYTAAAGGPSGDPTVTSPPPGSTLAGSTVTFSWTANGKAVTHWWIYIGTSPGGRDVYDSGSLGLQTSRTVSNLPTDGRTIYLKLWYLLGGSWQSSVFEYVTPNLAPAITSPVPGSTLPGTNVLFTWEASPNGDPVLNWWLYIGTSAGASNLFNSGLLPATAASIEARGLPTGGSTIYVRLFYKVGSFWRNADYQYTAANLPNPAITSPLPGSQLPGSTVTFTWAPHPEAAPVTEWWLYVGSTPGGRNYLDSGSLGLNRSLTVTGLPTNGSTVYVRLWFKVLGSWKYADFTYTAFST